MTATVTVMILTRHVTGDRFLEISHVDGLKGFAEIAKHLLYDVLGLLLPGGVFVLALAYAVNPVWFTTLLDFGMQHPWLASIGAYVLGYPVQALSRPIAAIFEWVLTRPTAILRFINRQLPIAVQAWINGRAAAFEGVLTGRHAHRYGAVVGDAAVEYDELLQVHWHQRLGLAVERKLSGAQLRDLSFSGLLTDRERLERFRTAASFSRGIACTVPVVMSIFVWQVVSGSRDLTWSAVGIAVLLIVVFYGFLERADMYDRMWNSVLRSQFLCLASRDPSFASTAAGASASGTVMPDHSAKTASTDASKTVPTPDINDSHTRPPVSPVSTSSTIPITPSPATVSADRNAKA